MSSIATSVVLDGCRTEGYKWDWMGLDWFGPLGRAMLTATLVLIIQMAQKLQSLSDLLYLLFFIPIQLILSHIHDLCQPSPCLLPISPFEVLVPEVMDQLNVSDNFPDHPHVLLSGLLQHMLHTADLCHKARSQLNRFCKQCPSLVSNVVMPIVAVQYDNQGLLSVRTE